MGYFTVERQKDGKTVQTYNFSNHLVDAGKNFLIDFMFNGTNWLTGQDWHGPRYLGVGTSTNTNAAVDGPTDGNPKSTYGPWQGVDNGDWKLTNETGLISRIQLTSYKAGNTVHMEAQIADSDVAEPSATHNFSEFGIFLGNNKSYPNANPITSYIDENNRANAMIVRAVNYTQTGTGFFYAPLVKAPGEVLTVRYTYSFTEG